MSGTGTPDQFDVYKEYDHGKCRQEQKQARDFS